MANANGGVKMKAAFYLITWILPLVIINHRCSFGRHLNCTECNRLPIDMEEY